jgi:hypothetical protein
MEVEAALRAHRKALDALQRLDKARRNFRNALLAAQEAAASKAELALRWESRVSAWTRCSAVPLTSAPRASRT